jgi:hypothetical protein
MRLKAHTRLKGPGFLGVVCIVIVVFANFGLLSGCGGGSSSGSSGEVITASTTSTPQSEQVGRSFQPLTVTVTNNGSPMGNVTVTFTAPSTGASGTFVNKTATDTETTNAGGIATATNFTANTIAGSYSVTASASGASSATFSLSNTAGAAATITATKGSNQTQALGVAFGTDLEATVLDSDSNPVSGAVVTFVAPGSGASATFAASGGFVSGDITTATTNASGVATSPTLTATTAIGTYTVTATVSGVTTPASFTLTNTVGAAGAVEASNGSSQYAIVGTAFAKPLQATVVDEFSNPVAGATVTFLAVASNGATGTFANGTATETDTTDSTGAATSSTFTANATPGCYSVTASGPTGAGTASFSLVNATPNVQATGGILQSATINAQFASQLQATVTGSPGACAVVQPLPGITVSFSAPSSGASGKFSDTSSNTTTAVTNALGIANAAPFTANSTAGSYTVTASAAGAPAGADFTLTNTAVVTLAPGTYIFSLSGFDNIGSSTGYPYSLAGAFILGSGSFAGLITGGELDFTNYDFADSDAINPATSSISKAADGNFIITLATCDGFTDCTDTDVNVGVSGVVTLSASLFPQNTAKGFVTEFDSAASGSGTLDLQTATSFSTGGYAFVLNGLDTFANPLAMGGVFNINGQQLLNASASVFDANDDETGTAFSNQPFSGGGVSGVDSFGRIEVTLDATDSADFPEMVLAGYLVDGSSVRLVETVDSYLGDLGGSALWQGGNTNNFSSSSISGDSYVLGLNGSDVNGALQVASLLTFGSSSISGFVDFNDLVLKEPASPDPVTAPSYTVDATGRVTVSGITDNATPPNAFNLQLYLDGSGHAFAISMDSTDVLGGLAYQQSGGSFSASDFTGSYAMDATGWDVNRLGEIDAIGTVAATGGSGTLSGTYDLNWLFLHPSPAEVPDKSVSGTYSGSTSILGGTIKGMDVTTCSIFASGEVGCTADVFNYYLIDASGDAIAIETDTNQITLGYFFQSQPN